MLPGIPCNCPSIAACLDEFAGRNVSHDVMRCYWVAFLRTHLPVVMEPGPEVGSHRLSSGDAARPSVSTKRRGNDAGSYCELFEDNHIIDCCRWASLGKMYLPLEAGVQNGGGDIGPPRVTVPGIIRSLRRT